MIKFLNSLDFANASGNPFITLSANRKSVWTWGIFLVILSIIISVLVLIKIPETIKIDIALDKPYGENEFSISLPKLEGNQKRIEPGQIIQLRLNGYQNTKFGYIPAKIKRISTHKGNSITTIFLYAHGGLVTSKQNIIHYEQGLKGNAVIFVKNSSLLFRLFDKLKF